MSSNSDLLNIYETDQDLGVHLILKVTPIVPDFHTLEDFFVSTLLLPIAFPDDTEQQESAGSPSKPEE